VQATRALKAHSSPVLFGKHFWTSFTLFDTVHRSPYSGNVGRRRSAKAPKWSWKPDVQVGGGGRRYAFVDRGTRSSVRRIPSTFCFNVTCLIAVRLFRSVRRTSLVRLPIFNAFVARNGAFPFRHRIFFAVFCASFRKSSIIALFGNCERAQELVATLETVASNSM
jgi:hypothetical protein